VRADRETGRQTNRQTHTLIPIHRTPAEGEVKIMIDSKRLMSMAFGKRCDEINTGKESFICIALYYELLISNALRYGTC